jgi:nitric oxide dioxygenase
LSFAGIIEMALTDDEIDLLHHSLRIMQERKQLAADLFYPRLFAIAPEVEPLFGTDMLAQTEKTIFAFGAVVAQIQNIEDCTLGIELARRHVNYGVEAWHYPIVGTALMSILAEVLGDEHFTPETEAAWTKAYGAISGMMIEAAYPPGTLSVA